MFCEKCGMQLEEGSLFCQNCGTKVENVEDSQMVVSQEVNEKTNHENAAETSNEVVDAPVNVETGVSASIGEVKKVKYCHNCGTANAENDTFCYACGTSLEESDEPKESSKFNSKKILTIAFSLAGALCVIACAVLLAGKLKKQDTLIFLSDNNLMSVKGKETYVIDKDAYESEDDVYGPGVPMASLVQVSEDGKYIFYPRDYDGEIFELCYKKLGKKDAEETKISSKVVYYQLLKNGNVVYREEGASKKLYISNLENESKIASDVDWYRISSDEKNIFWCTTGENSKMYVCDLALKNDKIKLDSDITKVVYVSEDFKQIIYKKEDKLYYLNKLKDKQKIDSNVGYCFTSEREGKTEVYYFKEKGEKEFTCMDLVRDDFAEMDAAIVEPNISNYQHMEVKPSYWGPREELITDDAYYTELDKYEAKLERDAIREDLREEILNISEQEIWYYVPGKDSQELVQGNIDSYIAYNGCPVFLYAMIKEDEIDKIPLSELLKIEDRYKIEYEFEKACMDAVKLYMVNGGIETEISENYKDYGNDVKLGGVSSGSKQCYFTVYDEETDEYTLLRTDIGLMDGAVEVVAEKLASIESIEDNGIYYITEAEDGVGDLYFNGNEIDSDVKTYSVRSMKNEKGILYLTDPDNDYSYVGTLNWYNGKESVKIEDDATGYCSNEEGKIAFLVDYDFDKYRGDLKVYDKKKVTLIEDDVTGILYY